nr:hypothetical protein BaRGS_017926 [Batillaria attramentaria]
MVSAETAFIAEKHVLPANIVPVEVALRPLQELGLDWTHPQEASIQHHTPSPDMEPAGEKEERPASQQLEAGH